jgi:hypothetical protein
LILALVNGFVIAALAIELLFESWSAFVLILIVLRIGNVLTGEIRSGKRRQNLPASRKPRLYHSVRAWASGHRARTEWQAQNDASSVAQRFLFFTY